MTTGKHKFIIDFCTVSELEKNRIMSKVTTDPDLQKFRKIDVETVQKISTIAANRRSSLDLVDLNYMSKEVTAAKEVNCSKIRWPVSLWFNNPATFRISFT